MSLTIDENLRLPELPRVPESLPAFRVTHTRSLSRRAETSDANSRPASIDGRAPCRWRRSGRSLATGSST